MLKNTRPIKSSTLDHATISLLRPDRFPPGPGAAPLYLSQKDVPPFFPLVSFKIWLRTLSSSAVGERAQDEVVSRGRARARRLRRARRRRTRRAAGEICDGGSAGTHQRRTQFLHRATRGCSFKRQALDPINKKLQKRRTSAPACVYQKLLQKQCAIQHLIQKYQLETLDIQLLHQPYDVEHVATEDAMVTPNAASTPKPTRIRNLAFPARLFI